MKKILYIILLAGFFAVPAKSQKLIIGTYNLRGDVATDYGNLWADRKLLVTDMVNKYKFDVIGLQETEEHMATYLIGAMPKYDSIGNFSKVPTGILYNKIRLTLQNSGSFWLSETPDVESVGWDAKFKRACVWAYFKDETTGLYFYALNTHFDHVGTVARTNSTALVLQKITDIAGNTPALFMGDLNLDQNNSNYITLNNSGLLKDSYNLAAINREKDRGTPNNYIISYRTDRIDHIFLSNTLQAYSYDVLLDTYNGKIPSDHYPVIVEMGLKYNNRGDMYRNFPEDFENSVPLKTTYASGNVELTTGNWTLDNAIIGGSGNNDHLSSGNHGVRFGLNNTTSAYLQMNFDVSEGVSKVTVQHSSYASDSVSNWQLEYSKDHGLSWTPIGPVVATHHAMRQQATVMMDLSGEVRFRINKFALSSGNNGRLSIDDFIIYKRKNVTKENNVEPLLAWAFASPVPSSGSQDSSISSLNHKGLNVSVLKRGVGLRTVNINNNPVNLSGGFAAYATVATGEDITDTTEAVANNLFFQFQVNPKSAYQASLSTLDIRTVATEEGAKIWYWKYSLDGVNYKLLAKPFRFNNSSPTSLSTVNLSYLSDFQNISSDKTIYFRLYVNGSNATSGNMGIGVSEPLSNEDYALSINGTVEKVLPVSKLVGWQFASPQSTGNESSKAASVVADAIQATDLVRGAGLKTSNSIYTTPIALSRTFATVADIATSANIADTTIAIANDMYYGFSFQIKPNYKVSLSSLNYKVRISSGGAKVWYWKYSIDGTNFYKIYEPRVLTAATNTEGDMQPQINLSAIGDLQNLKSGQTVYFRLYTNGSNITSGTTAIGRSASSTSNDYALFVTGTAISTVSAPKLIAWQFGNPQSTGGESTSDASLLDNALTAGALQRGAGLNAIDNINGHPIVLSRTFASTTSIETSATVIDTVKAVAGAMYFEFNVGVKPGYKLSLSSLDYKIRISSGGAKVWYWKYSLNGVDFEKVADPLVLTATDTEGDIQPTLDLSLIKELQNIPEGAVVYFRLYTNGSNITTGTTSIGRSAPATSNDYVLWVNGNVTAIPIATKLAAWQFATPQNLGSETAIQASFKDSAVSTASLERGTGLLNVYDGSPFNLSRAFASVTEFATSANLADTVTAVANDMYFGFKIKLKPNQKISLQNLNYKTRISSAGAKVWYLKYSLDGINFVKVANPVTLGRATDTEGEFMPQVDLSSISALQEVTDTATIYFRLYTNGSGTSGSSTSLGRSATATTDDYVLWISGVSEELTLPVQMVSFNGKGSGQKVTLNWQTVSEHQNDRFEVLHAKKANEFAVIGKVNGSGESTTLKNYSFTDNNPLSGINYYQLRQIDFNGKSELSEILAVKNLFNENYFNISVSESQLIVSFYTATEATVNFSISDILGRVLISQKIISVPGINSFSTNKNLQPGVYVATVSELGKQRISKKIIIN